MNNETLSLQNNPHMLSLNDRKLLSLSGISEVGSFDDKSIVAYINNSKLIIGGKNLNIKKLNLEAGELEIEGKISSLIYNDSKSCGKKRLFSGFFEKN